MRNCVRYILLLIFVFTALSCERKELARPSVKDGYACVDLNFGHKDFECVSVGTRATLDIVPESRITNMFVFVFVEGKRYYSHYFDRSQMVETLLDVDEETTESWVVNQRTSATGTATNGTLRMYAPMCEGAKLYMIANIDSDMLTVSDQKLNMISTEEQLTNYVVRLNQEITSRNGLFPMIGTASVDITTGGVSPHGSTGDVSVELERLDAKVVVNVRVATDNELNVEQDGQPALQTLKSFQPTSWQVVNLPKGCYLNPRVRTDDAAAGFFDTEPVMFETEANADFTYNDAKGVAHTVNSPIYGFSFYMLENHNDAKVSVTEFAERERKNKDAAGQFDAAGGVWTNAPETGTYMIIKGEVVMNVDVSSEAKQQQLVADVTYYVHLGDISKDLNNYDVNRNTIYTYTITIKGVNSIQVEVETSYDGKYPGKPDKVKETQPGAEGSVYVAKESVYTFDAHYGQRVFCFDAEYVSPDDVTWYVKTPFGKEGTPAKNGDVEIPSGMDYQWVHFMLNKVSDSKTYDWKYNSVVKSSELAEAPFSKNNQLYPGDGKLELLDVVKFISFIKAEKRKMDRGEQSAFRTEFDQEWFDWYNQNHPEAPVDNPNTLVDGKRGPWFRDRLYVTIFVDEYYYENDPITGAEDAQLWKRFVNQPNRIMHILCDNQKSLDGASSSTGSVVTIRQRSIQTPYNVDDADLYSAWGCETEDENADSYFWYYPTEKNNSGSGLPNENLGNSSDVNGLYNTARIWGCVKGSSWEDVRWDSYLAFERPNDYRSETRNYNLVFLREDQACLKYSAMMRNRDSNGNGIIDPEEIKWYNASIMQLESLYLGELGLSDDAKLYPKKYSNADGTFPDGHPFAGVEKWKYRVISSTRNNYGRPQILWAEEGVSVSYYKAFAVEKGPYGVKCVRNLGLGKNTKSTFDSEENRPQSLIVVTKPSDSPVTTSSVYKIDCRRVNEKSRRFRTSVELEPYDEDSEMARLYDGFETGVRVKALEKGVSKYEDLRNSLNKAVSPCPDGYRVPNIREAVLMYFLVDNLNWWKDNSDNSNIRIYTSTYYSLGVFGNGKNAANSDSKHFSWNIGTPLNGGNINLNGNASSYIRCIRDWNPAE